MLRDGLNFYCVNCWCEIEPCLASLCSMRCQDCRDGLTEPGDVAEAHHSSPAGASRGATPSPGSVNPSEPWPEWFGRTQGVPA